MKRILATLTLIFIVSLHMINISYTINYRQKNNNISKKEAPAKEIKKADKKRRKKKEKHLFIAKEIESKKENKPKIDSPTTTKERKAENANQDSIKLEAIHHKATWYKTDGTRVHRDYPTAAYNFAPRGSKLLVVNPSNNKSCTVEVTDRNRMGRYHIDLSHSAFGYLANHSTGTIKVLVTILE